MSHKHFDLVKACFWLIAFVIGAHVVISVMGVASCLWFAQEIADGKFVCDKEGKLAEVLAAALAAALAFAGGKVSMPPPNNKDDDNG